MSGTRLLLIVATSGLLLSLLVLGTSAESKDTPPDQGFDYSYEVIGASSNSIPESPSSKEKDSEPGNHYEQFGLVHSRRQRRSAHFGGFGNGLYHSQTHYRPVYVQQPYPLYHRPPHHHYPHPQPVIVGSGYHHHHSSSNSQSQAQAISANFVGPQWSAGFSGAAASAGSGNHIGRRK